MSIEMLSFTFAFTFVGVQVFDRVLNEIYEMKNKG